MFAFVTPPAEMKVEDGSDEAAGADSCTAFEDHTLRSPLGHNPEPESRTCLVMPTLSPTPPPSLMFRFAINHTPPTHTAWSRANTRRCRVPQEVVRVQVMNHDFLVHKQVLVKDSPYFERALNGPFAESKRQEIVLNEVSPGDFGFYVDILYRSFFVPKFILRKEQTGGRLSTKQILSFWQLSDRFLNGPLVDMAKESLDHRLSLYSPPHWIKLYQRCDKADIEERMSRLQDAFNQCLNGGMPVQRRYCTGGG